MSVPRTLQLPPGVTKSFELGGLHGDVAMLSAKAIGPSKGKVLLIPGWTGSKEDFLPLLPLLAAAGYDATAYDQAGQYESDPGDDYTLESYARGALRLAQMDSSRTHLLGHSFGGLVAQQAALIDPPQVRSLSLLCSGPGALGDSPTRPLRRVVDAIGKVPLLQIHQLREQGIKRPAQITAFLAKRFTANDPRSLRAMTQLLIDAPDVVDAVRATGVPTWVGRGTDDDAWPHDVQEMMAKRLGTEIAVVPDSAHSPAVENPEALMQAWLPFLEAH
ncbi:alpha/beta fold hydrolase [Aeromicrobium wangtongii]|uniref:Alpha/beta hydrolase n=1 Tax=Aeromicrobium wangtongii TaxID=2969247 RepID=A0ABY5M798_9ACTN|nr:alpha/beta hydrolase [Aeromicrobium wangtongii]MCD9199028.1 alpha/beta hydrolase [Aeromicrobium wangtongii]UUP12939.1 alpha/beta hydrolase [Aeromicrobium wangtongii]